MMRSANSWWFRFKPNLWSRLTGRGAIDWADFMTRLSSAEFRTYSSAGEAARSVGWAGSRNDNWLFGVAGRRIPLLGRSIVQQELLHAVQDLQYGLFSAGIGVGGRIAAEASAMLFGSTMVGVPAAAGLAYCGYVLTREAGELLGALWQLHARYASYG